MLVFAYAGFSWGTAVVPVQKGGNAVALVFDISWSMNAADAPGGLTRLRASEQYAAMLLSHLDGDSVSVILTKGDGVVAVPLTQDMETVRLLLQNLSPGMMSAVGTSIGKGIRAAIRAFPQNLSQFKFIWVFTDGDETDGQLSPALSDTVRYGIPVTLIGFGSERESETLAGDGKTPVKTALRSLYMKKIAANTLKKAALYRNVVFSKTPAVQYVDATEAGSALKLLHQLQTGTVSDTGFPGGQPAASVFEPRPVHRQGLFLGAAVFLFLFGILFTELDLRNIRGQPPVAPGTAAGAATVMVCFLCLTPLMFMSCKADFNDSKVILQSTWAWHQKNYRKAVAGFLQTEENAAAKNDALMQQYALYGLASTYLMQGENGAALRRLESIAPDAPTQIRFASCYDAGIVEYRTGNYTRAADWFRKALLADSTNVDAKINLELSVRQQEGLQVKNNRQNATSIPENKGTASSLAEKEIFNRIRENEQKRWEKQKPEQGGDSAVDY